jgi:hypothetical protein
MMDVGEPVSICTPNSYSLPLVPGLNFIANQLNCGANTLPEIMPAVPDGTVVSIFNNVTKEFDSASYLDGLGWDAPLSLNPGQGAFLNAPVAFLLTLSGAANVPTLPVAVPSGSCCVLSRQTNASAAYEDIVGLPPVEGTVLRQWNPATQAYDNFTFDLGAWTPAVPMMDIGEPAAICACGTSPALTLTIAAGTVTITWDGPAIYCLQSTPSLAPPIVWTTISGSSPIVLPASAGTTFFQLKCPCQ